MGEKREKEPIDDELFEEPKLITEDMDFLLWASMDIAKGNEKWDVVA